MTGFLSNAAVFILMNYRSSSIYSVGIRGKLITSLSEEKKIIRQKTVLQQRTNLLIGGKIIKKESFLDHGLQQVLKSSVRFCLINTGGEESLTSAGV